MVSVKVAMFAGATALLTTAASAADLPRMLPPIPYPPPIEEFSGWYLRGDIGMSNQHFKGLENALFAGTPAFEFIDKGGFDSGPIFGFGAGYQFNSWFRLDATVEYRGKVGFHALDRFFNVDPPGAINSNNYTASKSEWLGLLNAYVDFGTWWGVSPFVGAGVGFSRNTIYHFRDLNVTTTSLAFGDTASKWNFAWALHAGLGYKITPRATLEFSYRYVSLGDAESGDLTAFGGANFVVNPMIFKGLYSHDLRFGLRYLLGGDNCCTIPSRG
jgi:opacity protein-like surface antigen